VYDAVAARLDIIFRASQMPSAERETYTTLATTHAFGVPGLPVYSAHIASCSFNSEH